MPVDIEGDRETVGGSTPIKTKARVNLVLSILNEEIEPEFDGRVRKYNYWNIGEKGRAVVNKIIDSLLELMYENGADIPIQIILTDYLWCVYSYYERINRKPYFTQLSPSVDNLTRFEDWIYKYHEDHDSTYWNDFHGVDLYRITAQAKEALSKSPLPFISMNTNIEEI